MGKTEGYRAPAREARFELREKGSRFLAIVLPVRDEESVRVQLEAVRQEYRGATHICWAWRLGSPTREGRSDAGEPAGTAGTPILRVLDGGELSDVLAVVVRWFGGVKLGKGGLARAYAGSVQGALAGLRVVDRQPKVRLKVSLPFGRLGDLKRLVRPPAVEIVGESYSEKVEITLQVVQEQAIEIEEALRAVGGEVEEVKL